MSHLHLPNAMHLHLMINHAPLFGELFAAALLLAAAVVRSTTLLRTALVVVVLTALGAIPVFYTGRAAADAIGKVEGIDQEAIGPHEEAAERFLIATGLAGVAALVALLRPRRFTVASAAILTLLSLGLAGWTADRGGLIHHQELRAPVTAKGVERVQPATGSARSARVAARKTQATNGASWNRVSRLAFYASLKKQPSPPRARWVTASGNTPTRSRSSRCAKS
jgi:hypothetical protein